MQYLQELAERHTRRRRTLMRLFGRWMSVCAAIVAVLLAPACLAAPAQLVTMVETDEGGITFDRLDGYDVLRMGGGLSVRDEGHPELPVRLVRFALPEGTRPVGASARVLSSRELPGSFRVRPRQPEVPLSRPELARWVEPDASVYSSRNPYPQEPVTLLGWGNAGGQLVATVAFCPFTYVPADGKLTLISEAEIALTLDGARSAARVPGERSDRSARLSADRIRATVVNPEDVSLSTTRGARGDADYVIITSASHEATFQTLADWKEQKGLTAEVLTTEWIYANYTGVDNQQRIRNCIIDYYENHGTTWVLLGGDTGVVPARIVYAMTSDAGGGPDEDKIRCDLYYADLDRSWDENGDGVYGQIAHDNIDMYADIFVGRAPVDTATEVSLFVQKVLTYEGAPGGSGLPTDYQEDMLFMAEVLWSEPWTDHAICKNMIDDDSVPDRFDPITKLYQTSGNLSRSSAIGAMNDGYNIVNHNGHANATVLSIGGSGLYRSDFDGLTNGPRYGLFYSMGCWSAAIDYDCMGEHWVNSPGGGGAAYVGNSRYGWGSPGNPGGGSGDLLDRRFFHEIFVNGFENAGVAHANHKDYYVDEARSDGYMRYTVYELNLLGDPETTIWTENPTTATVGHPGAVPLGPSTVIVSVARDGAAVPGATVFLSGGDLSVAATTGTDGLATLTPDPAALGTLTLTVTGQGVLPYSASVAVVDEPADDEPPAAVSGLTPADPFDTGGVVLLDWTGYAAPADFSHYRVYRATDSFDDVSSMTPLATDLLDGSITEWTDTTVENRQDYYYAVTAVDMSGNEDTAVDSRGPIAASVNSRILVWDADDGDRPFDGSGDEYGPGDGTELAWTEALDSIDELYSVSETLPDDLSPFELIVYLGGVVDFGETGVNVPMTDEDAAVLTAFVDAGGDLYVEEPLFGGTYYLNGSAATVELWNRFHADYATGAVMATGNVQSLTGHGGRVSENMLFGYDYQNLSDQLVGVVDPNGDPGSSLLWTDQDTDGRGSLYVDPGNGSRRYMVPVLLGAMTNGGAPSTRIEYVTRILDDSDLIGTAGAGEAVVGVSRLEQNAPNPFNPTTTIAYSVARGEARVNLSVYDISGRLVATVVDGVSGPGEHVARWSGLDRAGRPVASGVYFMRLTIDGSTADSKKMVLLK
jgi:hypothetical protein